MTSPKSGQNEMFDEKPHPKLTKLGKYPFGEVVSALQKEIRRGEERAAVYWLMVLAHEAPAYAWKRVLITAAEDVGLADPDTVAKVYALAAGWRFMKENSWYVSEHPLTMAVMLLCRTKKSTEVEDLQSLTKEELKAGVNRREIPSYAKDGHTASGKEAGATWKEWYTDRHVTFEIPVNKYAQELWQLRPEWKPETVAD